MTLLARRAVAQAPLLLAVLAVVTVGATLLGVGALLLTAAPDRAFAAGLARAAPADVDVTAFVGGVRTGGGAAVAAGTRAVATAALAPLRATSTTRATAVPRELGPQREGHRRLAYLSGVEGLADRGRLTAGRWPRGAGEAAVLEPTARQLGLTPGRTVRLGPETGSTAAPASVTVRVVGVFRPLPGAGWDRDPLRAAGYDPDYRDPRPAVAYGPFVVDLPALLAGGSTLDRLQVTAHPDLTAPTGPALDAAAVALAGADARLTAVLGDQVRIERVASALPATLAGARAQQAATRSTVLVVVLLGLALTATALGLAGRLVAALRAPERGVLAALGAGPGQLVRLAALEALGVAAVAALVAVPASASAYAVLTHRPALAAAGLAAPPAVTAAQVAAVVAGALLLAAVLVVAALRPDAPPGRGGPALLARSGADLGLAGLAAIGWWQLRDRSGPGTDTVRGLAPVLCLLAGAALVTRLVPVPLRLADRLGRRSRRLVLPLAAFSAARRPRAAAVSLLLTLAAAAGTFGLAFGATWERSQQDQADLLVGTDRALTLVAPVVAGQGSAVAAAAGGVVSPVTDRTVVVGEAVGLGAPRLVAVDTTRAGSLLRGRGTARVAAGLAPAGPVTGVALAAPTLVGGSTSGPRLRVVPRLVGQDAAGVRTVCAGAAVVLDGRPHRLPPCGGRLVAVDLRIDLDPAGPAVPAEGPTRMTVSVTVPDADTGPAAWTATAVGPTPGQLTAAAAEVRGPLVRTTATVNLAALPYEPAEVVSTAFAPPAAVPVAVSRRLATAYGVGVGDRLSVTVGSTPVPVVVAAVVPVVPSVPDGPALLADVDVLSRALIAAGTLEPAVDGWWAAGSGPGLAALGLGDVVDRAAVRQRLTGGPLQVGLPAALAVLVPAAVLLALAGVVLHLVSDLRSRAPAVARLRGLGLSRRAVLGVLLAEHTAVLTVLLTAGALLGAVVSRLLTPLLVRSGSGAPPVPAVLARWPWPAEAALLAVLLAAALAAAGLAVTVQLRRAGLRADP